MLYRNFGKTGKEVSILGFGCMRLPILNDKPEKINEPLATEMLHYAIDHGVNYIDTAYPYHKGMSEIAVGNALKNGYRDQVYLSTKLPSWLVQKKEDFDSFLDEQLKKLQTDRIDFYLLHGLHRNFWEKLLNLDVFEFLDSAVEDGRIGHVGFSFHDELEFFKEVVDSYKWDFSQIQYNYIDQEFQAERAGLNYAADKMGTVIMEPLRGSCLTDNIPLDIQAIWDKSSVKRSLAEWALLFLWDQPEVNVVLSGMSKMEHVVDNINIAEKGHANVLTDDERNLIEEVRETYSARMHAGCTSCNYCMPCPQGVDIPLNLNLLNDTYIYKNMQKPSGNYSFLIAKGMSASFCNQCGACEEACTQNLQIREYLKEAVETFEK
ncbi:MULTISPECIES: aldo/keto reductase [Methanobacterium]|uniref:Aldo/keto reductase n=1 Tax=Methanobacterium veterum TaxID=408577 RepID=A0A9E4ZYL9_9EURY|nr:MULTISPECIES: aldo/keto reductase [Methanobacterium]MCZ3365930.1 aldo/keto reductase [Methanobacterium veterum]MCZ3371395.1 aldo/keto reductase [Methanobacterium veterum]